MIKVNWKTIAPVSQRAKLTPTFNQKTASNCHVERPLVSILSTKGRVFYVFVWQ